MVGKSAQPLWLASIVGKARYACRQCPDLVVFHPVPAEASRPTVSQFGALGYYLLHL